LNWQAKIFELVSRHLARMGRSIKSLRERLAFNDYAVLTAVATVVLALATTVLAVLTHSDSAEQARISNDQLAAMRAQLSAMMTANEQTKTVFHISQRASITTGPPKLDPATKFATFFLSNVGHMPSGPIEVAVHEATVNSSVPNSKLDIKTAVEYGWKRHKLAPVPPGQDLFGLSVPVREFSEAKFTPQGAYQSILIAGRVTFGDGFPDDGQQEWPFCFQSVYHLVLKQLFFVPCDAGVVIPQMEDRDGYPNNEQND
jgi:hypothetical protein